MLSNHQTRSDVEGYEQAPLRESVYNKKIQKHVPQRLDVTANTAQFSVRTGLMELLPDECMVGIECCFMNDPVSTNFDQVMYEEIDWAIVSPIELSQTQLLPSTTLTVDQGSIQVRNLFNGILTSSGLTQSSSVFVQTKQKSQSVFSTLNKYLASKFTWTFDNFTFNSSQQINDIIGSLTTFPIDAHALSLPQWNIYPFADYVDSGWSVIGVMTLQDTSQSLILQNESTGVEFFVGQYIYLSGAHQYDAYFRIQEVIDQYTIRITCGFQDINAIAVPISDSFFFGAVFDVTGIIFIANIEGTFVQVTQGDQIIINHYSDGSFEFELPNNPTSPLVSGYTSFQNLYMNLSIPQDCNTRMNIKSFTPVQAINNSVLNINIESPFFTSARTYDTSTNSYSQSIASLPVGPNYTVSYREPVNNRNCSMYQINKNILNNFDIPFVITQNDGKTIYKVQNPAAFFIKFTLWFYAQTDDERYFYIPSL